MKNNKNLIKKKLKINCVISEIKNEKSINIINSCSRGKMALSSEIANTNFPQWSFGIVFKDDN